MIELNHTIVPARDKDAAARFFARIFGLQYEPGAAGVPSHFAAVRVNPSLTFDFDTRGDDDFEMHHYAFKVSESEFDAIFGRVRSEGIAYGSGPFSPDDGKLNHHGGGRGVYFHDPDGHLLELLTAG